MISESKEHHIEGCQVPCLPRISTGRAEFEPAIWQTSIKRNLALPWNRVVKTQVKKFYKRLDSLQKKDGKEDSMNAEKRGISADPLHAGDWVRVKDRVEIEASLDRWNELKGCAFLDSMKEYCGSNRKVLQPLERFLDERDYKVKKCRGVVLLEEVTCLGTPVFGRCDRRCYLFWRVEWLEKIPSSEPDTPVLE
jgi:hypothetical protein